MADNHQYPKEKALPDGAGEGERLPLMTRMGLTPDSFKRRPGSDVGEQLNHSLKMRHLHMIAIGGSIGAGFFVGSGEALSKGGPASVVIDFAIVGVMMFNVGMCIVPNELSISVLPSRSLRSR